MPFSYVQPKPTLPDPVASTIVGEDENPAINMSALEDVGGTWIAAITSFSTTIANVLMVDSVIGYPKWSRK
jgi:hypothetical protein